MNINVNLCQDADIWGPKYWFFLHTIAYHYPPRSNEQIQRKYYDLLYNFPLFIPCPDHAERFADMLAKYPVKPYLDKRESFMRWVNFIHNKYNELYSKQRLYTFEQSVAEYEAMFKPKQISIAEKLRTHKNILVAITFFVCAYGAYELYK